MDSGTIHYPTPTFYSLVLALFLITLIVSFILPCITFLLKAPVRFLKAPARFLKAPLRFMHHTVASPSGHLGLDSQPIENYISLDIDSLISSISYVQDQTLHNVKTSNTFPIWFQDDYLSLSRCNDYHTKINSVEGSASVLIFAYQGYMIVKRCRETREIDSSSAEENLENRIAEQPREFGFKEVKLGSFGTSSYNTPKIQTATVGTGNHKRDFKVKSLKVAHAARLLEEEKETLRRLRKEAYQIELAKVKKENKIKMQGSFIKKMEELKKKQERRLLVVEQVRKQKLKFDYKFDENLKGTSISPPYKYSPNWNKYVPSLASEDNVAMVLPMERKNNHELIFCANSFCTMDAGNHKRDFKVKSLKAAGAARLCEQEKENLRRQRKKAYQIEIANARRENEIKMQGEFIKKMGELKKKQERRLLVAAPVQKQKLKKDFKHDANIKGTSIPPPYEYPPIRKKSVPSWASEDCLAMVIPLQQKINPESIFGPNSFCTVDEVLLPWESKNHAYDDD